MGSESDRIKHIVLLMLENHSFDQMLGCFKSVYPNLDGVDPAHPNSNTDTDGTVYKQAETDEVQTAYDPNHEHVNVLRQIANNNGGFVADFSSNHRTSSKDDRQQIMGYYGMGKLPALHVLANDFTICDRWFSSLPGPTWSNRFFALSGTSSGEVTMPESTLQEINPIWYIHQGQDTIFDRLNEKKRSWKVYYYDFPNSWLLLHQLVPANLRNYHHIEDFFNQDALYEPAFPDFVFIEPKYFGKDQNDDHPPHNVIKAEKLIADVYNAIRSNEDLFNTTLMVVTFDEHGGFYDHVTPPATVAPDEKTSKYSFSQLGVRVPAILVSPWVGKRVEHTIFDHTSLLKYMVRKWSLGPLGARVGSDMTNELSVTLTEKEARKDTTAFIRVPYSELIPPKPELEQEDASDHQRAIQGFASYMEQQTAEPAFAEASPPPSIWARAKKETGKVFVRVGNSLTREYQTVQQAKVKRITQLVESAAHGKVNFKVPPAPAAPKP